MHIAILNFSGNVGKTTSADEVFVPRMPGAAVIRVESINSDGTGGPTVRGEQFGEIQEAVMTLEKSISDIGASNVEDYMAGLRSYRGSHEDIDVFVVPTVPDDKQMSDTISTIAALADDIGVPAKKIRVLFNRVSPKHTVEAQFGPIFAWHQRSPTFTLNAAAAIHVSDIYSLIRGTHRTIHEIAADKTDFRAQMAGAAPEERTRLARMISLQRLAVSVSAEHDAVFKLITK